MQGACAERHSRPVSPPPLHRAFTPTPALDPALAPLTRGGRAGISRARARARQAVSRLGLNFKSKPQLCVAYLLALSIALTAEGRHFPLLCVGAALYAIALLGVRRLTGSFQLAYLAPRKVGVGHSDHAS